MPADDTPRMASLALTFSWPTWPVSATVARRYRRRRTGRTRRYLAPFGRGPCRVGAGRP